MIKKIFSEYPHTLFSKQATDNFSIINDEKKYKHRNKTFIQYMTEIDG